MSNIAKTGHLKKHPLDQIIKIKSWRINKKDLQNINFIWR